MAPTWKKSASGLQNAVTVGHFTVDGSRISQVKLGARDAPPYGMNLTRVRDDLLWEAVGGVNVGRWDQLRFTAEVQRRSVAPNAPPSLGLVFTDTPPFSRTVLVLQVGGTF